MTKTGGEFRRSFGKEDDYDEIVRALLATISDEDWAAIADNAADDASTIEVEFSIKEAAADTDISAIKEEVQKRGLALDKVYEVSFRKKVSIGGQGEWVAVTDLLNDQAYTFDLKATSVFSGDYIIRRDFSVINDHDGQMIDHEVTTDYKTNLVTVTSDKFSLYAVAYRDSFWFQDTNVYCPNCHGHTWVPYNDGYQCVTCGQLRDVHQDLTKRVSPQTGDNANVALAVVVVLAALAAGAYTTPRKRDEQ